MRFKSAEAYRAYLILQGWPISLTWPEWHKLWWDDIVVPYSHKENR